MGEGKHAARLEQRTTSATTELALRETNFVTFIENARKNAGARTRCGEDVGNRV